MQLSLRAGQPTEIAAFVLAAGWVGYAVILALGKRGAARGDAKRDVKSSVGFLLQCAAYGICFAFPRTYFSPLFPMSRLNEGILAGLAVAFTIASVWFCFAAARALGRQWALMARVIEGHELIRQGPYAVVRNPIYLAMLGMLIATGLVVSRWQALFARPRCLRRARRSASARRKICCVKRSAPNLTTTRAASPHSCRVHGA